MRPQRNKSKSAARRARARKARQAWRNYAGLNSWKVFFLGNGVQVARKLGGIIEQHSIRISVYTNPVVAAKNPMVLWGPDGQYRINQWKDNAAMQISKVINNDALDALSYGVHSSYRAGRTSRAK
jgi:hypothetical protein